MLQEKRVVDVFVMLSFLLLIGAGIMAISSAPLVQDRLNYHEQTAQKEAVANEKGEWRKFWRKTADEPAALWLAVLTAVLGAALVFQFRMLIRVDRTSRLAAEVAKQSAEALRSHLKEEAGIQKERPLA